MTPRSILCVPGSSPRMLEKAFASAADEVVIDLEDAVTPAAKDAARAGVVDFLTDLSPSSRVVSVRVNAPRTPWCHDDLIALAALPRLPHSAVVPKVESAGDLAFVERLLDGAERGSRPPLRVQALIESASGLTRVDEISRASARLEALLIGYADLAASLGRAPSAADRWDPAREQVLWAARAAGIRAVDGPHLGVRDDDDFRAGVRRAVELGFDGKWVIHPAQIEAVNEAFTPSGEDIAWARSVVDALETAEAQGLGAVCLDGQMLDEAIAAGARRVLARAALGAS
jgi:citrate lyase subunit beta/citryl-CoA lyase